MSLSTSSVASSKGLSLNEVRARVAKFVVDYAGATSERQEAADFWKALMRCYGVDDSFLEGIRFEYPARRAQTGRMGRIDVFRPGVYLIEHKSAGTGAIKTRRGKVLSSAEEQAFDYINGGDITDAMRPRWVVTSDFTTMQVTDLSEPVTSLQRTVTFPFAELNDHVELFWFLTGDDIDAKIREEQVEASIKAARLMGDLYAAMTGDADTDDVRDPAEEDTATMEASILLTRLLFLMFGDDAGLWETGLFEKFIKTRTNEDGSDLGQQLLALFGVLDKKEPRDKRTDETMDAFPYVNGAIYKDAHKDELVWFDSAMRDALLAACGFDWSKISPAVFGSLFQTVKKKDARRLDGEHYTSEENILKTLKPMFLDDFRKRLDAANTKPKLEALHEEFRNFRYVDPACGCGNFLIVAYREMRAIELDLLVKLKTLAGRAGDLILDPTELLHVSLDQFHGIELNWWPAKIAETAMYLVDHQANQKMLTTLGLPVVRLPINIKANIHHGNALTTDWENALPMGNDVKVFVFGNPPFVGRKTRNAEQAKELATAWGITNTGHLDFVTAWHAKALAYLAGRDGEFAFVTTNSISQGEPVASLFPRTEEAGWRIKFAHRTFAWNSETAAKDKAGVHCVVVGFTRDQTATQRLFDYATVKGDPTEVKVVTGINGYLVDAPSTYVTGRTNPLSTELPLVSFGSMPRDGGNLLVSAAEHTEVAADAVAAKYLREFVGADELIKNKKRWCLWMVDFDPSDVRRSALLKARLEAVKKMRSESSAVETQAWATLPQQFVQQAQPDVAYMCIPRHFSEHRLYATVARFTPDVIAGDSTFTCPDPDGFGFAIISSSMFITWQKTVGGRLESRPRFSKDMVWNTLPLPRVDAALRREIIKAGEAVLAARALHPDRSLADQYQPLGMDPELVKAHRALDKVVDKAFGAFGSGRVRNLSEAERQKVLFERYVELTTPAAS